MLSVINFLYLHYFFIFFFLLIRSFSSFQKQQQSLYYNNAHNANVKLFINIIFYHSPELDKGEQKHHIKTVNVWARAVRMRVPWQVSMTKKKKMYSCRVDTIGIEKSNIIPVSLKVQNWIILYDTRVQAPSYAYYKSIICTARGGGRALCCLNLILFHILFETTVPFILFISK